MTDYKADGQINVKEVPERLNTLRARPSMMIPSAAHRRSVHRGHMRKKKSSLWSNKLLSCSLAITIIDLDAFKRSIVSDPPLSDELWGYHVRCGADALRNTLFYREARYFWRGSILVLLACLSFSWLCPISQRGGRSDC